MVDAAGEVAMGVGAAGVVVVEQLTTSSGEGWLHIWTALEFEDIISLGSVISIEITKIMA